LPFPAIGDAGVAGEGGRLIVFFCGKRYKFQSDSFRDQRRLTRKMVSSGSRRLASLPSAIRDGNDAGVARNFAGTGSG
jgi:hypothetical protein